MMDENPSSLPTDDVGELIERLRARAMAARQSLEQSASAEDGDWLSAMPPEVSESTSSDAALDEQAASTLSRLRGERDEALGEIKALEWIVEDSLQRTELFRNAVAGIDRDFQSSEKHHPDDILIPVERFKLLRDAVQVDEEWGLPKPSRAEAARLKAEDLNRKLVEGLERIAALSDDRISATLVGINSIARSLLSSEGGE